jgi:putative ABC transport system substrate-binding protein
MAGEQEITRPLAGGPQVVIDRLAGLLAQFKSDRPLSFPLPHHRAILASVTEAGRMSRPKRPLETGRPVQAPSKYELVVNLKAAKAIGITVPPSVLARADEVKAGPHQ